MKLVEIFDDSLETLLFEMLCDGRACFVQIQFYSAFDPSTSDMTLLYEVETGPLPDMLHFSPDCKTMVIAIEGEGRIFDDGNFTNPAGGVTVLKWDGSLSSVSINAQHSPLFGINRHRIDKNSRPELIWNDLLTCAFLPHTAPNYPDRS